MRIDAAITWAVSQLVQSESPSVDAKVLLCFVLNKPASYLFTWPEQQLSEQQEESFRALIARRRQGVPVAYLTGKRDFWTLSLTTSSHTLIPRPDTEVLVEQVLERIQVQKNAGSFPANLSICDLGTGTGAIALALASELVDAKVIGVDFIEQAVTLANENAQQNNIPNAHFFKSDWFSALSNKKFHVIVANPPYIENTSPFLSQGDVRFEPESALTSGPDGLNDIRHIVEHAPNYLHQDGILAFEHGFNQANAVAQLLEQRGFTSVKNIQDYGGNDRVTLGYWRTC